jgi:hypothetical protein
VFKSFLVAVELAMKKSKLYPSVKELFVKGQKLLQQGYKGLVLKVLLSLDAQLGAGNLFNCRLSQHSL